MNTNELQLRASELKNVISDPVNYFKLIDSPTKETQAMFMGKQREDLSYLIYDKFLAIHPEFKLDTNYDDQKAGEFEVEGVKITCHADIVHSGIVVDIKNSKQDDSHLLANYWYQLNAYAYCFNCDKAYLFVDNNAGMDMDVNLCRMVEVPVDKQKFIAELTYAIKLLKSLSRQKDEVVNTSKSKLAQLMSDYYDLQNLIQQKQKELEALEPEIKQLMSDYYAYEDLNSNLICIKTFHKDTHRKMQVISDEWKGDYKEAFKIKLLAEK